MLPLSPPTVAYTFGAKLANVSPEDIQPDTAALLALALSGGALGAQRGLHKKFQRGPKPVLVHTHVRYKNKLPMHKTAETDIASQFESMGSWPAWQRSLIGAGLLGGYGLRTGAIGGGILGGIHGAVTDPGEYTDPQGNKQKRTRLQKVLHDLFAGVGMGAAAGGALGVAGGAAAPYLPR